WLSAFCCALWCFLWPCLRGAGWGLERSPTDPLHQARPSGRSVAQAFERVVGIGRQRVALVSRHLLVAAHRLGRIAESLVRLAEPIERSRPALGALAEVVQTRDRLLRLAEVVQIQVAEQLTADVPRLLLVGTGELLRLRRA